MSDSIRAKEFIVVDDQGRDRARLGMAAGAVSLTMSNQSDTNVTLTVGDDGRTRLEFRSGKKMVRLLIDEYRAQIKLKNHDVPESSCGLMLDGCGAWVYAEAVPDIGMRMLSNRDGSGASLWLSEKCTDGVEQIVRTRYVRPHPGEDATGAWQCDR